MSWIECAWRGLPGSAPFDGGAPACSLKAPPSSLGGLPSSLYQPSLSPVARACIQGNPGELESLLKRKISLLRGDTDDRPALLYAAEGFHERHLQCLQVLLAAGWDVNSTDQFGDTPLIVASRYGRKGTVRAILEKSTANVKAANHQGETALHVAVTSGWSDIGEGLVRAGADLNAQDKIGANSSLKLATVAQNHRLMRLMLEKGADPNLATSSGRTALHYACLEQDETAVSLLLDHGANGNMADRLGQLPVHHVACCANILKLLVRAGCNINGNETASWPSWSPLHYACLGKTGDQDCEVQYVRFLLDAGADMESCIDEKKPIDLAVSADKTRVAQELLARNCRVHRHCPREQSLLLQAIRNRNLQLLLMLYDAGARLSKQRYNLWLTLNPAHKVNNEFSAALDKIMNRPRTLKSMCRIMIRQSLGKDVRQKVYSIYIPETFRTYILQAGNDDL